MPTYVYKCQTCATKFEVQQAFTDPTLERTACGVCGGEQPVKKVFVPVGITFKGSGFYRTDSRSAGKTGASSASKSETKTTSNDAAATSSTTKPSTTSSSTS